MKWFYFFVLVQINGLNAYHAVSPNTRSEEDLIKSLDRLQKDYDYPFGYRDEDISKTFRGIDFEIDGLDDSEVTTYPSPDPQPLESWSVVWYIASFGGLITFFLVVSCSEWCCRRNARRNCQRNSTITTNTSTIPDTPPPSYDHFAPPSYESLCNLKSGEKTEFEVYVVPVEAFSPILEQNRRLDDDPPSYISTNSVVVPKEQILRVPVHRSTKENTKDINSGT